MNRAFATFCNTTDMTLASGYTLCLKSLCHLMHHGALQELLDSASLHCFVHMVVGSVGLLTLLIGGWQEVQAVNVAPAQPQP